MANTIYKDHLIITYAVLDTTTTVWHPRIEIILPHDHCPPCGSKNAAKEVGMKAAKLFIDNARQK